LKWYKLGIKSRVPVFKIPVIPVFTAISKNFFISFPERIHNILQNVLECFENCQIISEKYQPEWYTGNRLRVKQHFVLNEDGTGRSTGRMPGRDRQIDGADAWRGAL
jgi:hypothetical protein